MRVMFYAVVLSSTAAAATAWRLGVLRFTCGGLMSVEKVLILGNKQASDAEIRKFGRLTEGMDLMAVDPDAVSAAVRDHPLIRSASIYRSWVDATVTVRVAEYDIAGVIDLGRSIYVDPDGTPFKIAPPEALRAVRAPCKPAWTESGISNTPGLVSDQRNLASLPKLCGIRL